MKHLRTLSRLLIPIFFLFTSLAPAASPAVAKASAYQTGFVRWRAAENQFSGWTLSGVNLAGNGALQLDPSTAANGTDPYALGGYYGGNFYNGGSFVVGEATGPIMDATFGFAEAIASWNADTPDGTWIETLISARFGERWTKWYSLGIWASGTDTIQRHSVRLQGDSDGYVSVDTLVLTNKKASPDGFQLKLRLFSAGGAAVPTVRNASVAYSTSPVKDPAILEGNPANWNTLLNVPECSQMVYPDGGNVWCSPTSTSMVMGFWDYMPGDCEPRVRATVAGVYDWIYDGHGNWPFNTAYAASLGMEAYVARFTSLEQAEPWVKAGVPVVMSIAWKKGDLTGASVSSS
ncbi:MAG: C39 family peptidase, partial [Omnitrophica WOR_2 bacterium]